MDELEMLMANVNKHNSDLQEYKLRLEAAGIKVLGVKEGTLEEDGEIQLENNLHMQLGADGWFFLNRFTDKGLCLMEGGETLEEVIPYIQKALSEG